MAEILSCERAAVERGVGAQPGNPGREPGFRILSHRGNRRGLCKSTANDRKGERAPQEPRLKSNFMSGQDELIAFRAKAKVVDLAEDQLPFLRCPWQ